MTIVLVAIVLGFIVIVPQTTGRSWRNILSLAAALCAASLIRAVRR